MLALPDNLALVVIMTCKDFLTNRIIIDDDLTNISDGFILEIPYVQEYDLMLGLIYQNSGRETLRFAKFNSYEGIFNSIDFSDYKDRKDILCQLLAASVVLAKRYQTFSAIQNSKIQTFQGSSLTGGTKCFFLYSTCYYEENRHIGFAILNKTDPTFRIFRVDTPYGAYYDTSLPTKHWNGHKYLDLSLKGENLYDFLTAFSFLLCDVIEIIDNHKHTKDLFQHS